MSDVTFFNQKVMTGVSLYSAVDLIEILVLLLDVYSAQAFMTGDVISSGALLRSVFKLFKLGRLVVQSVQEVCWPLGRQEGGLPLSTFYKEPYSSG